MGVSTFGLGTPITSLAQYQLPWGLSPSSGVGINPFAAQQFSGQSPFQQTSTGLSPYAQQPLQQLQQLLQIAPQQLQHLLQAGYLQQQQLQHLAQIIQLIPAQLAQLQQLIQVSPQHMQQTQQPFTQLAGAAGGFTPWGVSPQLFGAQPSYVM